MVGLLASYLATRTIAVFYFGQSAGTYDYYFHLFLPPEGVNVYDILRHDHLVVSKQAIEQIAARFSKEAA